MPAPSRIQGVGSAVSRIRPWYSGDLPILEVSLAFLHETTLSIVPSSLLDDRVLPDHSPAARDLYDSELRGIDVLCELETIDGATAFRSSRFPTFYYGNGLLLHDPERHDADEWLRIHAEHFGKDVAHRLFLFEPDVQPIELIDALVTRGFASDPGSYLLHHGPLEAKVPKGCDIDELDITEEVDYLRLLLLQSQVVKDIEDATEITKGSRALFEKRVVLTEALGISWYAMRERATGIDVATCGMFRSGSIGRLQEVITPPRYRRQGFASDLVATVSSRWIGRSDVETIGLICDAGSDAERIYRRIGFTKVFASDACLQTL